MTALRIALWNASGLDNIGDRLIDSVTRTAIQKRIPTAELTTFTPWPSAYCQNRLYIENDGTWPAAGRFDAILVGGGALITGPPFADPAGQFFLLGPHPGRFRDRALIIWNAMCSDRQSRAPSSEVWCEFMQESLQRVDIVTVRNQGTVAFLRSCGVQKTIDIVPDVAVLATRPIVGRSAAIRRRIGFAPGRARFPRGFLEQMGRIAALNMSLANPAVVELTRHHDMSTADEEDYADAVARCLGPLQEFGDLLVFGFGAMYGDARIAMLVASKSNRARYEDLTDLGDDHALELIRGLDVLVACRLHACVSALAVGTPFVAVDLYADTEGGGTKLREFVRQAGFESRYLTLEALLSGRVSLKALVEEAIVSGRPPIEEAHRRMTTAAEAHFDKIAAAIIR